MKASIILSVPSQASRVKALLALLLCIPSATFAEQSVSDAMNAAAEAQAKQQLPTVVVKGEVDAEDSRINQGDGKGVYRFSRDNLNQFGESNGSITDVLDTVPNVQFSDAMDDPSSLSTLKPSSVSISGGRYYDNNFSINGISNNNLLDPAGGSTTDNSMSDVPGHEQSLFFDLDQIGNLEVYDSNVPAHYGRFTGGVVDAKLRRPSTQRKTRLSYFTTQSDWVDYRVIVNNIDESNPTYQELTVPEFERHRFSLSHEQGLNDVHSFRINVSGSQSSIPEISLGQAQDVKEQNYNVTASHGYVQGDVLATTFISYSPFEKHTFIDDTKDSNYVLEGGGLMLATDIHLYAFGQEHTVAAAINHSVNSRKATQNFYNWTNTRSVQWGQQAGLSTSYQGAYGDLDKYQTQLSLNWKTASLFYHPVFQKLDYGVNVSQGLAGFDRPEDAVIYREATVNTSVQCVSRFNDCVQNEQYFRERQIYPADKVDVNLTELAGFAELDMQYKRLNAVVGLRVDYDSFLRNTNLAWRNRLTFDLNADKSWRLIAGANRYYGGSLLSYKLREAAKPYYQEYRGTTNNIVNIWQYDTGEGSYRYDFNNVKTPFSDEWVVGINGALLGGVLQVKVLERDNKNEFARETTPMQPDGYRYYRVTNEGYSHYQSVSLAWDKSSQYVSYGFNLTWSETESSNDDYDDNVDAATSNDEVWYKGRVRTESDISQLRENYARPIVASMYFHMPITKYLRSTVKARYKGSYTTVARGVGTTYIGTEIVDGVAVAQYADNYVDKTRRATFFVDTKLRWLPFGNEYLSLTAELNNLFNVRSYSVLDSQDQGIEVGRSFWLGIETAF